jgi:hypothetical protein
LVETIFPRICPFHRWILQYPTVTTTSPPLSFPFPLSVLILSSFTRASGQHISLLSLLSHAQATSGRKVAGWLPRGDGRTATEEWLALVPLLHRAAHLLSSADAMPSARRGADAATRTHSGLASGEGRTAFCAAVWTRRYGRTAAWRAATDARRPVERRRTHRLTSGGAVAQADARRHRSGDMDARRWRMLGGLVRRPWTHDGWRAVTQMRRPRTRRWSSGGRVGFWHESLPSSSSGDAATSPANITLFFLISKLSFAVCISKHSANTVLPLVSCDTVKSFFAVFWVERHTANPSPCSGQKGTQQRSFAVPIFTVWPLPCAETRRMLCRVPNSFCRVFLRHGKSKFSRSAKSFSSPAAGCFGVSSSPYSKQV